MSGNITSAVTILQSVTLGSYSLSWAGTSPVGTIKLQSSDDYSVFASGLVNNAGTWTDLPLTVSLNDGALASAFSAPVSGNTGTGWIEWSTGAYALRLVFTFTSGTGRLQATFNGKVA
jgi:hypothetical protein